MAVQHQHHGHAHAAHTTHEHHDHGEHAGHGHNGDHHAHMVADFRRRFWLSLVLTVPLLALSPTIREWLGREPSAFAGARYLLLVLAAVNARLLRMPDA